MQSAFFSLSKNDFARGLIVAICAAVFTVLAQAFSAPGFDLGTFQWGEVGRVAVAAALAYLGKNLLTTQSGAFMGAFAKGR